MAALAARLNELAAANEQGLLDDDEYRLLRQDAFERFASGDAGVGRVLVEPKSLTAANPTPVAQPKPKKLTRRPSEKNLNSTNNATNNSIALFIRRATSPLGSIRIRSSSRPGSSSSKKNPDVALSLAGRSAPAPRVPDPHLLSPPTSPTRPVHNKTPDSKAKPVEPSPLSAHDIFEDGGLFTPSDIRRAIAELDDDVRGLVRAFEELEESAIRKKEAQDREIRGMALPGRNHSVISFSSPPTIQHRSHSDSAAAKAMHTRAWSKSTTSLRSIAAASDLNVPNSPNPYPTPPQSSHPQLPTSTLRKKSSVSSLASSFFSLKSKPSLPSIPSLSSKPSLPSIEHSSGRRPSTSTGIPPLPTIPNSGSGSSKTRLKSGGSLRVKPNGIKRSRSDSDSVASSNSNNTSGASTSTSFTSFAVSTSGKGIEGRPSTSVSVSGSGSGSIKEGRTSTNSTRPSTTTSHTHTHTHALPTTSSSQPTSRFRADSIDSVSVRSGKSGHAHSHSGSGAGPSSSSRSPRSMTKAMGYQYDRSYDEVIPTVNEETHIKFSHLTHLQSNDQYEDDDSEIHQIQQRKRDVMKRYEARVEYLRARLRGAELHERVVKGR